MESHITDEVLKGNPNWRNGYNKKQIRSSDDEFELFALRDRESTFEPQIIKKHQIAISDELRRYPKHIEDIYRITLSVATISSIADKIISKVKE